MTATHETTIWCDVSMDEGRCPQHLQVAVSTARDARLEARLNGWTRKGRSDMCLHHSGHCEGWGLCTWCTGNIPKP